MSKWWNGWTIFRFNPQSFPQRVYVWKLHISYIFPNQWPTPCPPTMRDEGIRALPMILHVNANNMYFERDLQHWPCYYAFYRLFLFHFQPFWPLRGWNVWGHKWTKNTYNNVAQCFPHLLVLGFFYCRRKKKGDPLLFWQNIGGWRHSSTFVLQTLLPFNADWKTHKIETLFPFFYRKMPLFISSIKYASMTFWESHVAAARPSLWPEDASINVQTSRRPPQY